ncbi:MAG TPA: double zinc ribbon domain-containing protein [Gemmatimonadaceae bacterium]|nr:double zinc ribbon domain-containing protein [Gemmatimonadaceae bacterium]
MAALTGRRRWRSVATRLGAGVADLLLPRVCVSCESALSAIERGVVCGRCWSRLALVPHPQCTRCGHPLRLGGPTVAAPRSCAWCALLPPYVRAARSVAWVGEQGTAAAIVHALKYGGWSAAAAGMAERIGRLTWPADVVEERALVVPVPLAPARLRERGYNQSALLAAALASRWGVALADDVIERARATRTQTRLTPGERLANVRGAFRALAGAPERVRGSHVVLVDDVVTTCATLNACAAALFAAGARIVSYATFGRAHAAGDPS